jgi:hypothetical protein
MITDKLFNLTTNIPYSTILSINCSYYIYNLINNLDDKLFNEIYGLLLKYIDEFQELNYRLKNLERELNNESINGG